MTNRLIAIVAVAALSASCIREYASDQRLEKETEKSEAMKTPSASELAKVRCDDVQSDFAHGRDVNKTEEDRLNAYVELYERLKGRIDKFNTAMNRNPDLAYQEGSQGLVGAREQCIQSMADARSELEGLIREIMQVLVVDDVKGGQTVKSARIDFAVLKSAIEKVELDDRDALNDRIASAEKLVGTKTPTKRR